MKWDAKFLGHYKSVTFGNITKGNYRVMSTPYTRKHTPNLIGKVGKLVTAYSLHGAALKFRSIRCEIVVPFESLTRSE